MNFNNRSMFPDKTKPISKPQKPALYVQKFKCQVSLNLDMCKCPVCSSIYTSTIRAPLIICDNLHKICLLCFNKINQKCLFFPNKQYAKCYKCNQAIYKLKLNEDILQIIKQNNKLQVKEYVDSLQQNIEDYIKNNKIYKFQQGHMLHVSSSHNYQYIIDQKGQAKYRCTEKKQLNKDITFCQIKTVVGIHPLPFGVFTIVARFQKSKLLNKNAQIGICTANVFNQLQIIKKVLCLNTSYSIILNSQLSSVLDVSKAKTNFIRIKVSVNMFKSEISWMIMDDSSQVLNYHEEKLRFGAKFLQSHSQNIYFFMRYENNESGNQILQSIGLTTKKIQASK